MPVNILVSACLFGTPCRYDGGHKRNDAVCALTLDPRVKLIPICPEKSGGLRAPREPSERRGSRVYSRTGEDVTAQFELGAAKTLETAKRYGCRYALLKERSPSCGHGKIYDGSFSGTLTGGDGVTAELLIKNGIKVFGESQLDTLLSEIGLSE